MKSADQHVGTPKTQIELLAKSRQIFPFFLIWNAEIETNLTFFSCQFPIRIAEKKKFCFQGESRCHGCRSLPITDVLFHLPPLENNNNSMDRGPIKFYWEFSLKSNKGVFTHCSCVESLSTPVGIITKTFSPWACVCETLNWYII